MGQIIELLVPKEIILPNKMLRAFMYICVCVCACVYIHKILYKQVVSQKQAGFHKLVSVQQQEGCNG